MTSLRLTPCRAPVQAFSPPLPPRHRSAARPNVAVISRDSLDESQPVPDDVREEAFSLATARLQALLDEAAEQKDRVTHDSEIKKYPAWPKVLTCSHAGSLVLLLSFVACLACGEDPFGRLGGATSALSTAEAAGTGALYALPLIACSVISRHPRMHQSFPVMEGLHQGQANLLRPFLAGLSYAQAIILLHFMVLPSIVFLYPAMFGTQRVLFHSALGVVQSSATFNFTEPLPSVDVAVPDTPGDIGDAAMMIPLLVSGLTAAIFIARKLSVDLWQYRSIWDGMQSADRYVHSFLGSKS